MEFRIRCKQTKRNMSTKQRCKVDEGFAAKPHTLSTICETKRDKGFAPLVDITS